MNRTAKLCLLYLLMCHQLNGSAGLSKTFKKTSQNLSLVRNLNHRLVAATECIEDCVVQCSLDKTCHGFGYKELPNKECFLVTTPGLSEPSNLEGFDYFVVMDLPSDCDQVHNKESGLALLEVGDGQLVVVYCEQDLDGGGWLDFVPTGRELVVEYCEQELGGWLVFQRRLDGSVDFFRTWDEYKNGFGNISGEFWLGNDNINLLTANQDQILKVELGWQGRLRYADYAIFSVANEKDKFRLRVSGYSDQYPPGDSLSYHDGQFFTTWDRDNDKWSRNCASENGHGAWWYNMCHVSDLNGVFGSTVYGKGIHWKTWIDYYSSLPSTRMMIRHQP